jgi:hypothetical protein
MLRPRHFSACISFAANLSLCMGKGLSVLELVEGVSAVRPIGPLSVLVSGLLLRRNIDSRANRRSGAGLIHCYHDYGRSSECRRRRSTGKSFPSIPTPQALSMEHSVPLGCTKALSCILCMNTASYMRHFSGVTECRSHGKRLRALSVACTSSFARSSSMLQVFAHASPTTTHKICTTLWHSTA